MWSISSFVVTWYFFVFTAKETQRTRKNMVLISAFVFYLFFCGELIFCIHRKRNTKNAKERVLIIIIVIYQFFRGDLIFFCIHRKGNAKNAKEYGFNKCLCVLSVLLWWIDFLYSPQRKRKEREREGLKSAFVIYQFFRSDLIFFLINRKRNTKNAKERV